MPQGIECERCKSLYYGDVPKCSQCGLPTPPDPRDRMSADELFSNLKVEVVSVCGGHMVTTHYYLVVKYRGRIMVKVEVGNDGNELGFQLNSSRTVSSESEI